MDEVVALFKIRKGNASGMNGIPIEFYSLDIKYFTPLMTTLFDIVFAPEDYPKDCAQGLIHPVQKKMIYQIPKRFCDSLKCESI